MKRRYCKECGWASTQEEIRKYVGVSSEYSFVRSPTVYLCDRCAYNLGWIREDDELAVGDEVVEYRPEYFGLENE